MGILAFSLFMDNLHDLLNVRNVLITIYYLLWISISSWKWSIRGLRLCSVKRWLSNIKSSLWERDRSSWVKLQFSLKSFMHKHSVFLTSVRIWITWHPIIGQFCFWRFTWTLPSHDFTPLRHNSGACILLSVSWWRCRAHPSISLSKVFLWGLHLLALYCYN